MRRGLSVLMTGLLLVGSACAHGGGGVPEPNAAPVRVEVTNQSAATVEIYIVVSGARHRLGSVDPSIVGHFMVPPAMIGVRATVDFQAKTGYGTIRGGQLRLEPGDTVDFVITPNPSHSMASLRP